MAQKVQKILIDANVFIALNYLKDSCHQKAKKIFQEVEKKFEMVTNNYLVSETLTVLLIKTKSVEKTKSLALGFYYHPDPFKMIQVSRLLQLKSLKIFSQQEKPKLSFADCTLISQAKEQKIKNIFTFDANLRRSKFLKTYRFYP